MGTTVKLILPSKKEKIKQLENYEDTCPYCGSKVVYMTGEKFKNITEYYSDNANTIPSYMENADMLVCSSYPLCNSYCIPSLNQEGQFVGTVASKELRKQRQLAHYCINIIYKTQIISTRNGCYYWLSRSMKTRLERTHVSLFNMKQSNKAIRLCSDYINNNIENIKTFKNLSEAEIYYLRYIFEKY